MSTKSNSKKSGTKKSNAKKTSVAEEVAPELLAAAVEVTETNTEDNLSLATPESSNQQESANMSTETITVESTETTTVSAPEAAPKPPRRVERRVYVNHAKHGTCVSFAAMVYLAPAGLQFAAKSTPRLNFTVGDGALTDDEGRAWLAAGENPGCGPRCPGSLREKYGSVWQSLSHADRAEIIKSLVPAAK